MHTPVHPMMTDNSLGILYAPLITLPQLPTNMPVVMHTSPGQLDNKRAALAANYKCKYAFDNVIMCHSLSQLLPILI